MVESIYKYILETVDSQQITIHGFQRILSVIDQRDQLVLYALVDPSSNEQTWIDVKIVGTGNMVMFDNEGWDFRGSISQCDGLAIWHVWTRKED